MPPKFSPKRKGIDFRAHDLSQNLNPNFGAKVLDFTQLPCMLGWCWEVVDLKDSGKGLEAAPQLECQGCCVALTPKAQNDQAGMIIDDDR